MAKKKIKKGILFAKIFGRLVEAFGVGLLVASFVIQPDGTATPNCALAIGATVVIIIGATFTEVAEIEIFCSSKTNSQTKER
jgi:hypothetical protein